MRTSNHLRILASAFAVVAFTHRIEAATATIDVNNWHQRISGFGTCSAWNGTLTASEGELLWDTVKGAGLSLHRIMIERTGSPDDNEKRNAKLATGYGVKVWGTPWYSKYAVKVPNQDYDTLYESNMQAWANDLATMAKSMKDAGTPLFAISPQNESDLGWVKYDAKAMALWVGKYLGPTMAAQAPETKVMGSETCNWYGFSSYEPVLMADANVRKYASIIATHLYGGDTRAYPEIQQSGKEFWQTEIYDPITDVEDPGITSALRVAKLIHEGQTIANFNAWHFWWIKPCTNCANGALWVAATNQPSKRLWIMGNWSRYVRPGFVRVEAPGEPTTGVSITAYRDTSLSKLVVVAMNTNDRSVTQEFSFPGAVASKVTAVITDATRDLGVQPSQALASSSFSYALPAKSVTTLVIDMGKPIPAHRDTVYNGTFAQGASGWGFNVWGGGAHGDVVDGEYEVQIDSLGTANSSIQLVQNGLVLVQGKSYEVKFDARADGNRTLEANVELDVSPWTSYLQALQNFELNTTKTTHSFVFTMTQPTDSNGRLSFNAGASTESVFLDNVSIRAVATGVSRNVAPFTEGLVWSDGYLRATGREAGKVRILSPDGRSREFELVAGKAYTGKLPSGIYRARILGATRDELHRFVVLP